MVLVKTNKGLGMSVATMDSLPTPIINGLVEGTPAAMHPNVHVHDTILEVAMGLSAIVVVSAHPRFVDQRPEHGQHDS